MDRNLLTSVNHVLRKLFSVKRNMFIVIQFVPFMCLLKSIKEPGIIPVLFNNIYLNSMKKSNLSPTPKYYAIKFLHNKCKKNQKSQNLKQLLFKFNDTLLISHSNIYIFFEGLCFSKKINIKNFKINTRLIKSLMEEEFHQERNEGLGGAQLP